MLGRDSAMTLWDELRIIIFEADTKAARCFDVALMILLSAHGDARLGAIDQRALRAIAVLR